MLPATAQENPEKSISLASPLREVAAGNQEGGCWWWWGWGQLWAYQPLSKCQMAPPYLPVSFRGTKGHSYWVQELGGPRNSGSP